MITSFQDIPRLHPVWKYPLTFFLNHKTSICDIDSILSKVNFRFRFKDCVRSMWTNPNSKCMCAQWVRRLDEPSRQTMCIRTHINLMPSIGTFMVVQFQFLNDNDNVRSATRVVYWTFQKRLHEWNWSVLRVQSTNFFNDYLRSLIPKNGNIFK